MNTRQNNQKKIRVAIFYSFYENKFDGFKFIE